MPPELLFFIKQKFVLYFYQYDVLEILYTHEIFYKENKAFLS